MCACNCACVCVCVCDCKCVCVIVSVYVCVHVLRAHKSTVEHFLVSIYCFEIKGFL